MNRGRCPNQLLSKYTQRWTELIVLYELGVLILGEKAGLGSLCVVAYPSLIFVCTQIMSSQQHRLCLLHIPATQGPQGLHLPVKEEAFREGLMKVQINEINSLQHSQGWELLCSFFFFVCFLSPNFLLTVASSRVETIPFLCVSSSQMGFKYRACAEQF